MSVKKQEKMMKLVLGVLEHFYGFSSSRRTTQPFFQLSIDSDDVFM